MKKSKKNIIIKNKKLENLVKNFYKEMRLGFFMNNNFLKQVLIGLFAGFISGFFSTGGGLLLVPGFIYLLNVEPKKARGTSVFCILPMVLTSSFFYYKGNFINWKIALLCGVGGAIGGYIGAKILKIVSDNYIKIVFTFFIIFAAYKMLL